MFRGKFDFKKKLSPELVQEVNSMQEDLPGSKDVAGKIVIVCGSPFIANIAYSITELKLSDAAGVIITGGKSPAYKMPNIFIEGLGALIFAQLNDKYLTGKMAVPHDLDLPEARRVWHKYSDMMPETSKKIASKGRVLIESGSQNTYENFLNSKPHYQFLTNGKNTPIVVVADNSMIVRAAQTAKTVFPNTIVETVSFPSALLFPYTREWQDTFIGRSYIMSDIFAMARYSGMVPVEKEPKHPIKLDKTTKTHLQKILELTR